METLMLFVVLAVTVEAVVEYARTVAEHAGTREMALQLAALCVAVLLCLVSGADIYAYLGVSFGVAPWVGSVLTGIFASRGANYASDIIGRLQAPA